MLIWSLGFLILSAAAAYFGFWETYTPFADLAQVLFFIFLSLFLMTLAVAMVTGGAHGGPALRGRARIVGLLVLTGLLATGVYTWIANDLTAERVGREIDRRAVSASADASEMFRLATRNTSTLFAAAPSSPPPPDESDQRETN